MTVSVLPMWFLICSGIGVPGQILIIGDLSEVT
uniref:Uncharacterized protein n=1 Tax=Myoviridae sp. ctxlX31 TaxID=2827293 RepID=A0A8S5R482_9CAUD|nr:MAG TPA: protein of unknown function (DUF1970) [Myoviridae sp. ctxlX31]